MSSQEPTTSSESESVASARKGGTEGTTDAGVGPSQNQGDPLLAESSAGDESAVDHPQAGAGTADSASA